jgi:hypothetical protein
MRHHFVAMQMGPANFVDFEVDQTNVAGQLDASDEAEHIHPNLNGQKNDFSKLKWSNIIHA